MRAVLYGNTQDYTDFMASVPGLQLDCRHLEDYDDLRHQLVDEHYDLVIVTADGAHGMEACIGVRKTHERIPLFWFSNDREFGPQSYRLGCTYFSTKPFTEHRLRSAFERLRE